MELKVGMTGSFGKTINQKGEIVIDKDAIVKYMG